MIEYVPLIYWIGYIILFIGILFIGSFSLARDAENERDILDLLFSLLIMPFFLLVTYFSNYNYNRFHAY